MSESRKRLSVHGLSRLNGGAYDEIAIAGIGMANADLTVGRLNVQGIGRFAGSVEAGACYISGVSSFLRNLKADTVRIDGVSRVRGRLSAREIACQGTLRVAEDLTCESLSTCGVWSCRGNVDARTVQMEGAVRLSGVLCANTVNILFDMVGRVRDIIADNIVIQPAAVNRKSLCKTLCRMVGIRPVIHARRLEGEDVQIDAVRARRVRARSVVIGPHCTVDTVEYSESIQIHPQARVRLVRNLLTQSSANSATPAKAP